MARRDATGPVTLSVLDRLIDRDPKTRSEIPFTRAQSLRELKLALKRDLEWLLNTRKTIDPAPDSARETVRSVYHYGFADISSKSVLSSRDQSDLVREMELAIAVFRTPVEARQSTHGDDGRKLSSFEVRHRRTVVHGPGAGAGAFRHGAGTGQGRVRNQGSRSCAMS